MYVCIYVWKLGIILNYELFLYTTIVLNVVYIFKYLNLKKFSKNAVIGNETMKL